MAAAAAPAADGSLDSNSRVEGSDSSLGVWRKGRIGLGSRSDPRSRCSPCRAAASGPCQPDSTASCTWGCRAVVISRESSESATDYLAAEPCFGSGPERFGSPGLRHEEEISTAL